jgi:uncharacterized membrane protein
MLYKIGTLFISTSAIFAISLFSSSKSALAWFEVCNKSGTPAQVAFAYADVPDSREYCDPINGCEPLPPNKSVWNSHGWWNLSSGQCAQVYPHELTKRNSVYYVHAEAQNGSVSWPGTQPFCTLTTEFTLALADRKCNGEGRTLKNFKEINTRDSRNYTYTLSD